MLKVVHIAVDIPPEKLKKPKKLTKRQKVIKTALQLLPILHFNDRQKALLAFPEEEAEIKALELQLANTLSKNQK